MTFRGAVDVTRSPGAKSSGILEKVTTTRWATTTLCTLFELSVSLAANGAPRFPDARRARPQSTRIIERAVER